MASVVDLKTKLAFVVEMNKYSSLTFSNGMPYFFRMEGEMRVILCLKKASQFWELPGKNPRRINEQTLITCRLSQLYTGKSYRNDYTLYLSPDAPISSHAPGEHSTCRQSNDSSQSQSNSKQLAMSTSLFISHIIDETQQTESKHLQCLLTV